MKIPRPCPIPLGPIPLALGFSFLVSGATPAQVSRARLLQDLNKIPVSNPKGFVPPRVLGRLGKKLILNLWSYETGEELWMTEGSPSTTKILKDIVPGPDGSAPRLVGRVGSLLLFMAETPGSGRELWVTDGTVSGTKFLKELMPGKTGELLSGGIQSLAIKGKLFFTFVTTTKGAPLWVTDGTPGGTRFLHGFDPKPFSGMPKFGMLEFRGKLFFSTPGRRRDAWVSDGTVAGTQPLLPVRTMVLQDPFPTAAVPFASELYFFGNKGKSGWDLYSTDGTRLGTRFRLEMGTGFTPVPLFAVGGHLLYQQVSATKNSLIALDAKMNKSTVLSWDQKKTFSGVLPLGSKALLVFQQGIGLAQAYLSDGTPKGTQIEIPTTQIPLPLDRAFVLGSKILFLPKPPGKAIDVWDRVQKTFYKIPSESPGLPAFQDGNRILYPTPSHPFLKAPGISSLLWQSDGSSTGTHVVNLGKGYLPSQGSGGVGILPMGAGSTRILTPSSPKGKGIFEVKGPGLVVKKLGEGNLPPMLFPKVLVTSFGKSFLIARGSGGWYAPLYVSDGTPKGSHQLDKFQVRIDRANWIQNPYEAELGDRFLFVRNNPLKPKDLLVSTDGTLKGTRDVFGKNNPPTLLGMFHLTRLGNRLFFFGVEKLQGKTGISAYATDGSTGGVQKVPVGMIPFHLKGGLITFSRWGDLMVFPLDHSTEFPDYDLVAFDPKTKKATLPVAHSQLSIRRVIPIGNELLLFRQINFKRYQLDVLRKVQGKIQVKTVQVFPEFRLPEPFRIQDRLFAWMLPTRIHQNWEIWANQGGSTPLKPLYKLPIAYQLNSNPLKREEDLFRLGSHRFVFPAKGEGYEVVVADFRNQKTTPIGFYSMGGNAVKPFGFQLSDGKLFFFGQDLGHGLEPQVWVPGACGKPLGIGCSKDPVRIASLEVEDPILGSKIQVYSEGAPQGALGLLIMGFSKQLGTGTILPGGSVQPCRLFFDLAKPWLFLQGFKVPQSGVLKFSMQIPNSPSLAGLTRVWQAVFPQPGGVFETSNAYEATFGR